MMINSSMSGWMTVSVVYGCPVTSSFMYASPSARVTANTPLTRLLRIKPPALVMRLPSFSSLPLWSYDRRRALPARHRMMRASPTLAVYRTRCLVAEPFSLACTASADVSAAASFSFSLSSSPLTLDRAATAGAIAWEPVADRSLGTRSSQRRTATAAVQPLFFSGSFSSWASTVVKV